METTITLDLNGAVVTPNETARLLHKCWDAGLRPDELKVNEEEKRWDFYDRYGNLVGSLINCGPGGEGC